VNDFETEYRGWLNKHIAQSSGERLRRLKERHGFGERLMLEQAWWPVLGNLDHLFPEYEFVDPDGNYYYMDFAYVRLPRPTCLESDSFSSHARDIDRWTFSRGLERQNEIMLADWNILRFSIDKLKDDPKFCQQTVRRLMTQCYGHVSPIVAELSLYKREIIRLATRSDGPITPETVGICLGKKETFVLKQLHELVQEGWLVIASGNKRIRSYRIRNRLEK
jgi:hypothetical protein